jgi:SAM-dependent methyltransferase
MGAWFDEMQDRLWLRSDDEGDEEAGFIKRALKLRSGQKVLDLPCGAGRIAVHLALAGCQVTCADLRKQFIARARKRLHAAGADGAFVVTDMRSVDWDSEFHGIYNWGGSFGYFSDDENRQVVSRLARALRPGGRLLIEQLNRERILRSFLHEVETEVRLSRNRWDAARQRVESTYYVGGVHDPRDRSSMRLYTPRQMRDLF